MADAGSTPGLRERKKRRTREQVVAAARELFAERGYDATSVADIAEAAEIGQSTFFVYFPTKADVLFAGYDEVVDEYMQAVSSRSPRETAIDATIAWHADRRARLALDGEASSEIRWWRNHLRSLIDADPILQALERQRYVRAEDFLTREVAHDLGDAETALRPRLIAATKVSLLITLFRYLSGADGADADQAEAEAYVERCLAAATDAIAEVPLEARADVPAERLAG
jgi:AcrR family transcriptional regulator